MSSIEVLNEINKLNPRKSPGPDGIGAKLIQLCPDIFADNLSIIYNKSIQEGVYPVDMKIAKVIALYKKGSHVLPDNYRPISLLSIFDKIFEKLLCRRLLKYLELNNYIYKFQFGFRNKHSTTFALIDCVDNLRYLLDNENYVLGLFVDFRKAFDTVDHEILLNKLEHYGIRGQTNDLFRSYLTGRKQYCVINGVTSNIQNITCGVPQGSVLGPILFILYINDMHRSVSKSDTRLFADDSGLYMHHKRFDELINIAKTEISHLFNWCVANKLTVNYEKTFFYDISQHK